MTDEQKAEFRGYTCKHRPDCESRDKYGWDSCGGCECYEAGKLALIKWVKLGNEIPKESE